MRGRTLLISLAGFGSVLTAGVIWLALEMGPLGALSVPPPFSAAVHTEASPCLLLLTADARSADRRGIAKTLQSYAARNGFKWETAGEHPLLGNYSSAIYDGPGTLNLLASADTRRISIQIFRDEQDHTNYAQQIAAALTDFKSAGLSRTDCK